MRTVSAEILGAAITASAVRLDEGWDVSVTGGVRTHVGAVSLAAPSEPVETLQRSGHKDAQISEQWARNLSDAWNAPVCVRCGIHYDNPTRDQLRTIVAACERLLVQIQKDS